MTSIGERIRIKREELELSQEDLAKKLGYKSKSTINKVELGINDISQSKIVEYANALNTTPAYLMGWEEEQKTADAINYVVNNNEVRYLIEVTKDFDKESMDKLLIYAKKMKELKDMEQDM